MGFSDHTFHKSNVDVVAVQQGDGPFSEPDNFRFSNEDSAFSQPSNRLNGYLTSAPADQIVGLMRMRFQVNQELEEITREGQYGLYCMASQADLTQGAGSFPAPD